MIIELRNTMKLRTTYRDWVSQGHGDMYAIGMETKGYL